MAKNYIKTKYGTRIDVTGLTPEQVARVKSVAEDRGAYGAKGAALADSLRNKNKSTSTTQAATTGATGNAALTENGGVDPGTEGLGETATTIDNFLNDAFKNLEPLDLSGAPKVLTDNDLAASRQGAYQSIYDTSTQNLQRNKSRDLEAQKQELADRGIPYDPANPDSLYGKTVGSVNERYDQLYKDAENAANMGADQRLSTLAGVNATASDQFLKSAMAGYQSQLDAASTGGSILNTLMSKFGIDQQTAQNALNARTQKQIAQIRARQSGGGGGGGADTGPIVGGVAPGFGV